ncbi:hypothetical protein [Kordiimonas sp. SCSIO 12610]|uniref:hypothetical protein n=1 Tax=Kordiimonas sp. SCSIO 12610 TaxID=2829597 RepID=UPI00210AB32F|nr:hypothetical protein [Kordiimonas sp. SCSIO 12610]UTW54826.1 hypothetical protein KFF44_13585 [Kordiimonas sp. SCSIO 12610]
MGVYTMVVVIVAIVFVAGTVNRWISAQKKIAEAKKSDEAIKLIKELEERVITLERITTDKGISLREEIDAL